MATTKKSVTKKPVTKKATTTRKTVAKKAPVKRATSVRTKKATHSEWDLPSAGKFKSFKVAHAPKFFTVRITDQTIYWAILGFIVLALGIWVVTINEKVQYLYDQIDAQNADDSFVAPPAAE